MYLSVSDNARLFEQNIMTNLLVTNLQAASVANELSNYSSLVGRVYPPTRREQFLSGAEGMAQQSTQRLHHHPSGLPGPRLPHQLARIFQRWLHLVRSLSPNTSEPGGPYHASPRKSVLFLLHEMNRNLSACLANHLNMSCGEIKYKVHCFTEDVLSQSDI